MGTVHPLPVQDDVRALIASLQAQVDDLRTKMAALEARHGGAAEQKLLSKREVAKRLGVSRSDTLQPAIAAGKVRTVMVGKRERIPMIEFIRLRDEGWGTAKRTRAPLKKRSASAAPLATPQDAVALREQIRMMRI